MCGIVGGYGIERVIYPLVCGAIRQQHRGHDSAGAVTYSEGEYPKEVKKDGRIGTIFDNNRMKRLKRGSIGIVQNKYATTGGSDDKSNRQPFTRRFIHNNQTEFLSIAHNGNFTNPLTGMMDSTSDTELVLKNFENTDFNKNIEDRIFESLFSLDGAFSILAIHKNVNGKLSLIAVRDPYGFRPFCFGKYNGGYIFASESVALTGIGAEFERFVEPGEIIVVDEDGLRSYKPALWQNHPKAFCVFELIYFAHPCSLVETDDHGELYVWQIRHELGKQLVRDNTDLFNLIDVLCGVPNSANVHASGVASAIGLPMEFAIIRNEGAARTFISSTRIIKDQMAGSEITVIMLDILRKFSFLPGILRGRRAGLVDDSIVRGNTMKCIVKLLRQLNNNDIKYLVALITSAPIMWPCFYGIRITNKAELVFNQAGQDLERLSSNLELNKIYYLNLPSQENTITSCTGRCATSFCNACFTGKYPTKIANMKVEYKQALEI